MSNLSKFNLIKNESSGSLNRVGIIDIGSNSVRLVVFDGAIRSPAYFYNEKVICSLGSDLSSDNLLNIDNKLKAMAALKRFVTLAKAMNTNLMAVATAAVRSSKDGLSFCEEIFKETGLSVRILSGEEEAILSAQGVLLGWPEANGLVCDLGGSSLELAEVSKGKIGKAISCPIGPLNLSNFNNNKMFHHDYVNSKLRNIKNVFSRGYDNIYLVGGSWRSIARIQMELIDYPLVVLQNYQMQMSEIKSTINWIQKASIKELRTVSTSSVSRLRLLHSSSIILENLIEIFQPKKLTLSSYGIREGLLYSSMTSKVRKQDPLLEACRHMELCTARIPGFGLSLFEFIKPIFKKSDKQFIRLTKAACFLHDVSWRAHPDYRAEVCFDNAIRANLGGIDHRGRAILALAVSFRYKTPKKTVPFAGILSILNNQERKQAEILGKAMRFGAMLSGSAENSMGELYIDDAKKVIRLNLNKEHEDICGDVVQQRFSSLASSMKYKPAIVFM